MATLEQMIVDAARRNGIDPAVLKAFVRIESGGNPNARTGSYSGLLQLSPEEFRKGGGQGDITDPQSNLDAGAATLRAKSLAFQQKYGREPTATDLYLMHQQGEGGYAAHMANPAAPAWQNMASTAEGRQKGPAWSRQAIWGNVPDDVKAQYGSVDNLTSADFVNLWNDKVGRFSGQSGGQGDLDNLRNSKGDENMLGMLAMLGKGASAMGGLGGALPSLASAADGAGLPDDLSKLFGNIGASQSGGAADSGFGDGLKLAQGAAQSADGGEEGLKMQQRPFDMATLAKMLQSSPALGAALRRTNPGAPRV